MRKRDFLKGLFLGLLVPLIIFFILGVFNIAGIGNYIQSVFLINSRSLHTLSVSEQVEGSISGIIGELEDPYSTFLDAAAFSELQEEISGTYSGIGVYLTQVDEGGYVTVMAPIKNSPAFEAGILAGDRIISLDGEDLKGVDSAEVASKIKGMEASQVHLVIDRDGEQLEFDVERRDIEIPTVEGNILNADEGIGYISISMFSSLTPENFIATYNELNDEVPLKGLILDLRNNPGGSVPSVVSVAEQFLGLDEKIVWMQDRSGETFIASENSNPIAVPVVVLINENSASASEILAGALKDHEVATLVGVTSFGKGIVQSIFALRDGAAIKLTTARYLTPNRTDIHEKGIEPHVEVMLDSEDVSVIYSLDPEKDNQLAKALELLEEKKE